MNDDEYQLAPNSNLFIKERQQKLWKRGYEHKFTDKGIKIYETPINNVQLTIYQ
jgi:hypothetical protein